MKGGFVQQQKNRYYLKANREKNTFLLCFLLEGIVHCILCLK